MIDYGKELQKAFDDGYKARDAEIVRCKDCKWSYDAIGGTFCSNGCCVDCEVDIDFFCADGERMAVTQSNDSNVLDALDGKEQEDE